MSKRGKLALFVGLAAGVATGVIFSPDSGKKFRDKLKKEIDKGTLNKDSLFSHFKTLANDIKAKAAEKLSETESKTKKTVSKVKKAAGKAKSTAKSTVKKAKTEVKSTAKKVKTAVKKSKKIASDAVSEIKDELKEVTKD
jgi:gas vesicle protein